MKPAFFSSFITTLVLLALSHNANAGWKDLFSDIEEKVKEEIQQPSTSVSSEQKIASALKEALNQGVGTAVQQLGRDNGFLGDATVKIPMPDTLRKVEKGLRKVGKDKYADRFIDTMNHAAEKAVPKTTDILLGAIKDMTLSDAIGILNGEQDAATRYFERTSSGKLQQAIKPIVSSATDSVGLTDNYKKMISKAGFLASYIDADSLDIDQYITNRAVDGLFIKIAAEEKRIRENPLARTSELLRDVFGSIAK